MKDRRVSEKKWLLFPLVATVALIWGFSFIAMNEMLKAAEPIQILTVRWTLTAFFFLIPVVMGKIRLKLSRKAWLFALLTGVCEPCLYAIGEIYGVALTSVSVSAIFIAIIPCMVLLLQRVVLRRKISRGGMAGIPLAFLGVLVCTVFSPAFTVGGEAAGIAALLAAVFTGGFYSIFSGRAAEEGTSPVQLTAVMAFLACVYFNLLNLAFGYGWETYRITAGSLPLIGWALFLSLGCSIFCFVAFNYVLGKLNPVIGTNLIANSVTVVGVVAGILVNGDPAGLYTVVGVALTLGGVLLSSKEA